MTISYPDPQGKSAEFSTGTTSNDQAPRSAASYVPSSTLDAYAKSADGMSATDAGRRLIGTSPGTGEVPDGNGMSASTHRAILAAGQFQTEAA